jgi:hypothetical protein
MSIEARFGAVFLGDALHKVGVPVSNAVTWWPLWAMLALMAIIIGITVWDGARDNEQERG